MLLRLLRLLVAGDEHEVQMTVMPAAHSAVYTKFTVHTPLLLLPIRQIQKRSKFNLLSDPAVQISHETWMHTHTPTLKLIPCPHTHA